MTPSKCMIATNQHTGTWVMINFVQDVIGCPVTLYDIHKKEGRESEFIHVHFAIWRWWKAHSQRPEPPSYVKSASDREMDSLIGERKTVITMRDPVLALITRHNRHPGWCHKYIIEGFLQMVRLAWHPNVFLFAVDAWNEERRFRALLHLAHEFFGKPETPIAPIEEFARDWDTPNATGDVSGLRAKYVAGDFQSVRHAMPDETALLLDHKNELVPFFKQNGYKDLLWF